MSTAGLYTNISRLGQGTYGAVYKATEIETGKVVAFKRMNAAQEEDGVPGAAIREVCLLKELRHDNVVELFDVLFNSKKITMIFELCDFDLKNYMDSKRRRCLDAGELRPTLKQIFNGIHFLHSRSVVHRDIKPQNIFLNVRPVCYPKSDGTATHSKSNRNSEVESGHLPQSNGVVPNNTTTTNSNNNSNNNNNNNNNNFSEATNSSINGGVPPSAPDSTVAAKDSTARTTNTTTTKNTQLIVKLGDFGLARVENIPVKKYSHEAVTLWYRSPDVLMGSGLYSFPVDIWSIGVTFFEMVTGRTLFSGQSEEEQLVRVFRLMGSPTRESWPSLPSYPNHHERLNSARRGVQEASVSNDESKQRMLTCYSSAKANPANRPLPPPLTNTYQLPEELWYPQPLFDRYMDSTRFREICGDDGVDLLRQCLAYEPNQRITAAEALRHPFLRNTPLPSTGYLDVLMTTLQQSLNAEGL